MDAYEAVRVGEPAAPGPPDDGRRWSTLARQARAAARSGYDGLVVRNEGGRLPDGFDRVRSAVDVDLVAGATVEAADPSEAAGHVGRLRPQRTVVVVEGGTPALNRYAAETERVDVLAAPMADEGDVNHVIARAAAENGVRIEFDFGAALRQSGGARVGALSDLRKLRELVTQYDVPHVVSARAATHLQVRAPRELVALGQQIGFDREDVAAGLAEWGRLVDRNRARDSAAFIAPGVERGNDEA